MISLSQTRYGSAVSPGNARQGNSRRWRSYQASSAAASGSAANRSCDNGFVIGVLVRIGDMNKEQDNEEQDKADATLPARDSQDERRPDERRPDERRPDERRPGLRAVGPLASRLAAPVVARHGGGILARLKADWPAVIGADIAAATWPQALGRDGALKLRVAAATALELQHRAPLLIERINVYLGRPAISRLVFVQGPLPLAPPARRASLRQLGDAEAEVIDRQIAAIGDSELKAALARLGKSVASSAARRR
jgi:hypothetical protein